MVWGRGEAQGNKENQTKGERESFRLQGTKIAPKGTHLGHHNRLSSIQIAINAPFTLRPGLWALLDRCLRNILRFSQTTLYSQDIG